MLFRKLVLILAIIGLVGVLGGCSIDWSHTPTAQYGQYKRSR